MARPGRLAVATMGVALLTSCALPVARAGEGVTPSRATTHATTARPNIVFILTDDLDDATFNDVVHLPQLNTLLTKQGVSFTNYFVPDSLCCPSRASFMRGQYVHNTGVLANIPPSGGFERWQQLGLAKSTIATWLQAGGYRTGLLGKYLNDYPTGAPNNYVPPGWNEWDSPLGAAPYNEFNYTLNSNGVLKKYGSAPGDYLVDVLANKSAQFISQNPKGKPFFLEVTPFVPHEPATPAPRYANAFPGIATPHTASWNQADVSNEPQWLSSRPLLDQSTIDYIDTLYRKRMQDMLGVADLVQTVITALTNSGQLNNTYIVFSSDNGFHLGQHRLPAGKETPFEEDIHVPLVIRGPGIKPGRKVNSIVREIDLAPTFAALAGVTPPSFVDGRSFVTALTGTYKSPPQDALIEHFSGASTEVTRKPDGTIVGDPDSETFPFPGFVRPNALPEPIIPPYHAIRTRDFLYVEYSTGERQLYNLVKDPNEMDDIVTQFPARANQLHKKLLALETCVGPTACS
jgi:arylsulfatase A-like enzyme